MELKQSGIILFVENYEAAYHFYTGKIGLKVRWKEEGLAVLDFGGSYLMLEDGGEASGKEKARSQNPVVIRFDVMHFDEAVEELQACGVEVEVKRFEWGTIGVVIDPEGNRVELKD